MAITKQALDAWKQNLLRQIKQAKFRGQTMALRNSELDLEEVERIMAMLTQPLDEQATFNNIRREPEFLRKAFKVRDDIQDVE